MKRNSRDCFEGVATKGTHHVSAASSRKHCD
jgi:hypothetical protein